MNEAKALLLTDVVDSTRMTEQLGDAAMAGVWAAHDRAARSLLPVWRGREIDKTDGMLLLFDDVADAVQYAVAYHAALAALPRPLKARAGLHVGAVVLRENPPEDVARGAKPLEVDGLAKPTAARVMSLARGGQTLITPEAKAAVDASGLELPTQSHGHWVMKGVSAPVELFEIGLDPSAFATPPDGDKVYRVVRQGERWLPVREIPNNLPWQPTSFIGRERELDEIKKLLGRVRLLTLLGMGGLGKTRLSIQAATELMADYPDGVWFLELSPLRDGALVVSEVAQVLGLREEPGRPLLQTVAAFLKARRCLFVVDNCEHLVKPTAQLVFALLKAAPHVRFVASSREALRVPGEQSYPIRPLPVPKAGDSFETLAGSTAVRLFVERAQAHRFGFELTPTEAPAVAALVARLEGIPLALELAAARVRTLSVAEINRRLADRYQVLVDGDSVLEERQQTLRALVDWSYEMLAAAEQQVFDHLAVFAGGFDLPAVRAVVGADQVDGEPLAAVLRSLLEKSLVMRTGPQAEGGDDDLSAHRLTMLETLRDYAREKLADHGQAAPASQRHCEHFFALAKQVRDGLRTAEQGRWVERMETELDNLRSAIALPLAGGADAFVAVKLAVAMQNFWILRGYVTEGRAVVRNALALPAVQAAPMAQAWALYVGASLATAQADHAEARRMLEECLALRRTQGNPVEIAATLSTLALARFQGGDVSGAIDSESEALQLFRGAEDGQGEAIGHLHLAQFALFGADDGTALQHVERGLALARRIGNRQVEGECALVGGQLANEAGDTEAALDWFGRALRVFSESGDKRGEASARWGLGRARLDAEGSADAWAELSAALRAFQGFEMREEALACMEDFVVAGELAADTADAAALATAITQLRERMSLPRSPRRQARWARVVASIEASLPPERLDEALGRGLAWTLDEAAACALRIADAAPA